MIELKTLYGDYPPVYEVQRNKETTCWISVSPTANCQTFSIGNAVGLKIHGYSDIEIKDFIKLVTQTIGKFQCIVDLCRDQVEWFTEKFTPFVRWEQHIEYTNSNGTPMTLFLIKFKVI